MIMKPFSSALLFGAAVAAAGSLTGVLGQVKWDVDFGGTISDVNVSNPDIFTFTVSVGPLETVSDVNVQLAIRHANLLDLHVFLESPTGTFVELFSALAPDFVGGNLQNTLIDDQAASPIGQPSNTTPPWAGPADGGVAYQPQDYAGVEQLAAFNGENPNGTWNLYVFDEINLNTGDLYRTGETAPWGALDSADGTALFLTVIPEPQQYLAVTGLGLIGIAFLRRRMGR